jgi:hypothetical protein
MEFKFSKIMGMNKSTFIHSNSINPYPTNVENMVSSYASKWQMGFNSAFKRLIPQVSDLSRKKV